MLDVWRKCGQLSEKPQARGETAGDPRDRWLCGLLRPSVVRSLSWAHGHLSSKHRELPDISKCCPRTVLSLRPGLHCSTKQLISTVPTFQKFPCIRLQERTEQLGQAAAFFVIQSLSCVWPFGTPRIAARQASLSFTIFRSLLKLMSIESTIPSSHLMLCCPLLPVFSIFPWITVFSNESAFCIRWPKYWNFSSSPSNEYSWLVSFRIDWFDLLAVQGTLKSLLQHHSLKISVLQHSAFFMVQLLHLYMTTGKTIALIVLTFVRELMSLLLNTLSRFVIAIART